MYGQLNLFSEELHEYFFMIQPDPKTEKEVKLYKRIMNSSIHLSKENLWSVPHLSLFKWSTSSSIDDYIIQKTEKALRNKDGFKIQLDGLDVYSHGNIRKTLVLKVKNPQPILSVNHSLTSEFRFRPHKIRPHITIVRSIPSNDFDKLSDQLNEFNYKGEFDCKKITILKKMGDGEQKYITLHEAILN